MRKLVLLLVLATPGCCSWFCVPRDPATGVSVESYREALTKIRGNVAEIRSDLVLVEYDPVIKEADLQLIDATLTLCDDTLTGGNR